MSIDIKKLENGLTIICQNMPHLKTVAVNVMIKVGSRDEDANVNGISHLIEHMAFKGTTKRTAAQIAEEFDNIGGYNNAYTSREVTSYHCKVIAEEWKTALDILSDITLNSVIPEDELEREKEVVIQEIMENNDNPDDVISDVFQLTAYPNQALGRSILGDEKTVRSLTRGQILEFMSQYYQPSNMVVALAGNVTIDEAAEEAEKLFRFKTIAQVPQMKIACYNGGIAIHKEDFEQVHVAIGFEGLTYKDPHYYTLQVLSNILGGSMSSRLFQEVREKRGLTYNIGTNVSAYEETGIFVISAGTSEDKFREVIEVCFAEMSKMMEYISEEELVRSKKQLIAGLAMASENSNYCSDEAAKCYLTHGRYVSNEEVYERISKVTTDDVLKLASRLFTSKMTFSATGNIENSAIDFSKNFSDPEKMFN